MLAYGSHAFAADETANTQLQGVQVTGSHIRRAEQETANPVLSLSAKDLAATGAATLGDILQSLPIVAGNQPNAQYNYPPSGGVAEIGLRGLTSARTLLLIDCQRFVSADVNQIPVSMIERIEILKQGASAVYGSDAIAGVVNIITVKRAKGLTLDASYGQSQQDDTRTANADLSWGKSWGRTHLNFGANFSTNSPVHASDRWWGAQPYGFADGAVADLQQGSVATPNGFIVAPVTAILRNHYKCSVDAPILTRKDGATGNQLDDYRCFNYSPFSADGSDLYNYQTENYLLSPMWHAGVFTQADTALNDNIKLTTSLLYSHAHARNQQAPEAFNLSVASLTLGEPAVISKQSLYNPFGVNIGEQYTAGIYSTLYTRATADGDRIYTFDKDLAQLSTGLRGNLFDRFDWNTTVAYGFENGNTKIDGVPRIDGLVNSLGPSFMDANGVPTCGTADAPIAGCTPINLLGTDGAGLGALNTHLHNTNANSLLTASADLNGPAFKLWAGPVNFEFGYEFRRYTLDSTPDELAQQFDLFENNQAATHGSYSVNEVFGEALVPLLKDQPLAHAVNFSYGLRYSKYSAFSATTTSKYALEYRPISDILARATYATIFRAPTVQNLYGGASEDAPSYTDPCNGLTTPVGANANIDAACNGVPRNGNYQQFTTQAGALVTSNPNLKPESGYTTDFGLVYSPSWYKPLSLDIDYWHYTVDNAIAELHLQDSLNACFDYGVYCQNISRDPTTGQLVNGTEPQTNADRLSTTGLDAGIHLNWASTELGKIQLSVDSTYLQSFNDQILANNNPIFISSVAGQYDALVFDGGFPRLRATSRLNWSRGSYNVTLTNNYVGNVNENVPANGTSCPDGNYSVVSNVAQCTRAVGSADYTSIAATYTYKPWQTSLTLGVDDLFDEEAQLAYSAPVPDTVLSLYNVVGRYFYAKVKVHLN